MTESMNHAFYQPGEAGRFPEWSRLWEPSRCGATQMGSGKALCSPLITEEHLVVSFKCPSSLLQPEYKII